MEYTNTQLEGMVTPEYRKAQAEKRIQRYTSKITELNEWLGQQHDLPKVVKLAVDNQIAEYEWKRYRKEYFLQHGEYPNPL